MPTYEYACRSCGRHLEVQQSFSDEPLTTCPTCGGQLRKVFGNIGISFKGSGFYSTDNRSSHKGTAGDKSGDKADGTGDGKAKADAASGGGEAGSSKSDSGSGSATDKGSASASGSGSGSGSDGGAKAAPTASKAS